VGTDRTVLPSTAGRHRAQSVREHVSSIGRRVDVGRVSAACKHYCCRASKALPKKSDKRSGWLHTERLPTSAAADSCTAAVNFSLAGCARVKTQCQQIINIRHSTAESSRTAGYNNQHLRTGALRRRRGK